MAVWEKKVQWQISQVSWTDWTAQDVYYWQEHSFQYSANINCDDEMHGIKLANKAIHTSNYAKCQLVSDWEHWVFALPLDWGSVNLMSCNGSTFTNHAVAGSAVASQKKLEPWVIFQDRFRWGWGTTVSAALFSCSVVGWNWNSILPFDHAEATDESISWPDNWIYMWWAITAILNYNNTRLVVATSEPDPAIWVYYPELDPERTWGLEPWHLELWHYWWKKVLNYEAWVTIVALTCSFEYLKVWAVDEWWNTKIYYYQGNNNLRDTFVYNVVDLTWERVLRAYSINWTDYYITSIDWTDGYVNLNKMVGTTPIMLFHQRAWLDPLDVNFKAPYFVWPVSISAAYKSGRFYIWDQYWVFQFTQNQQGYDKWYMKWMLRDYTTKSWSPVQVYGLCENQWFLYVSDSEWCRAMRLYDTWVDGYQNNYPWVLISREYEWKEWGTITKMLDEIRLNYELNPLTSNKWSIDIYVSPNNLWKNTHTFTEANGWYHVMHIDNTNWWTRTEKSNLFNDMWTWDASSFKFDWQTITYAIVIQQNTSTHATPIVRQIDIKYHTKDKVNNVYDIN
jgi:hypothetical protein